MQDASELMYQTVDSFADDILRSMLIQKDNNNIDVNHNEIKIEEDSMPINGSEINQTEMELIITEKKRSNCKPKMVVPIIILVIIIVLLLLDMFVFKAVIKL